MIEICYQGKIIKRNSVTIPICAFFCKLLKLPIEARFGKKELNSHAQLNITGFNKKACYPPQKSKLFSTLLI